MSSFALADLESWATEILARVGLRTEDAHLVAASLAFAERRGVASHGMLRLPTYVQRIRAGGINRNTHVRTESDLGALVIIDADDGPGASTAVYASDLALERGRRLGIGCVVARNANHFGPAGFYSNRIADGGLLGLVVCNTESVMCPPAGGRPVLGTNPFALAPPTPYEFRAQVDMATTTASQGKLLAAAQQGESIPLGWAVDHTGQPTTSPAEGLEGALLPSGGPKGFGLAFAIDALLAVSGANVSPAVAALNGDPAAPQRLGHMFLAIRADAAGPLGEYCDRISALVEAIHASGAGSESTAPPAPGEPELRHEENAAGCLEVPDALLAELVKLAQDVGVPLPESPQESVVT